MDNFKKILVDIQDLIKSSNGNLINYGKSNFIFKKRYDVSLDEINDFEEKYKVKFPKIYREFLLTVGSCTLFQDELLPGFDFLTSFMIGHNKFLKELIVIYSLIS